MTDEKNTAPEVQEEAPAAEEVKEETAAENAEEEAKADKKKSKKQEKTFEDALARLNEIVSALESGSAPLDKSLAMFEEGVALVKLCNARLDTAEQKVKILTSAGDGTLAESDMK